MEALIVNVNAKNEFKKTPLMIAARNGHTDIINLLLRNSADVNAEQKDGSTAL